MNIFSQNSKKIVAYNQKFFKSKFYKRKIKNEKYIYKNWRRNVPKPAHQKEVRGRDAITRAHARQLGAPI
jgi:hypothetical protein